MCKATAKLTWEQLKDSFASLVVETNTISNNFLIKCRMKCGWKTSHSLPLSLHADGNCFKNRKIDSVYFDGKKFAFCLCSAASVGSELCCLFCLLNQSCWWRLFESFWGIQDNVLNLFVLEKKTHTRWVSFSATGF